MIRSHPKDTHVTIFPKPWEGPLLKTFIFPVVENLNFQEAQVTQQDKSEPELPTRLGKITNSVDHNLTIKIPTVL